MKNTREWFFWDWKSIIRTVFVFIIITLAILFLLHYPDWKRKHDSKNYTERTTADLINVKRNEKISMSELGNKTVVYSLKVRYKYTVKNHKYESIDIIPNSKQNRKLILQIYNSKNDKLKIKYDPKKPEKSIVIR